MVGTTGIEPVTTAMSRQCSTAELRAPIKLNLASTHQGRARYHRRGVILNMESLTEGQKSKSEGRKSESGPQITQISQIKN